MNTHQKVLVGIVACFALLQLIPSQYNQGTSPSSKHVSTLYPTSKTVEQILVRACNDCHSDSTVYPAYAAFQPLRWWIDEHVEEGTRHLNFDAFADYAPYRQFHKIEEVLETVAEGEMPLKSYTYMHEHARLNETQKKELRYWAEGILDSMKRQYPADSLVHPKRRHPGALSEKQQEKAASVFSPTADRVSKSCKPPLQHRAPVPVD